MKSAPFMRHSILFVCSGNVFRSLAAEQALKTHLRAPSSSSILSAGTDAKPVAVHEWVRRRIHEKGGDVSHHVPRLLTQEMVESSDLVIAMGRNHKLYIRERFGREAPLFNQVCFGCDEPILDLHEVFPDWEQDLDRAHSYVCSVIDSIWESVPNMFERLTPIR